MNWRTATLVGGLVMALVVVNVAIGQREAVLRGGETVLLELAPVDPRSLMQGDYMRLNFAVAGQAFPLESRDALADGHLIVALDAHRVGRFRRLADGRPPAADEIALRYRVRGGRPNFATNAFFFEEGQARAYENARYGEFRVAKDGEMILTGLRDARFEALKGAR